MPSSVRGDRHGSGAADKASAEKGENAEVRQATEIARSTRRGRRRPGPVPLHEIGIAGLTRSRVAWFVALLLGARIVTGFVGQAGDATRATEREAEVRAENARVEAEVAALRDQVALVNDASWVAQQARTYNLGSEREIPFVLAPDAPALPADAPGSDSRRLGTLVEERTPLESWLDLLFGDGD